MKKRSALFTVILGLFLMAVPFLIPAPFGCSGSTATTSGGSTDGGDTAGTTSGGDVDSGGSPAGGSASADTGSSLWASSSVTTCTHGGPYSFPGAEGWGACAQGGRGGSVCYVTSTASDTAGETEGTLQYCLNQPGAAYILFKTSGLINSTVTVIYPNKTIAGQTSPGGITVRGIVCDNGVYERTYRCNDMIIRNIRSRPGEGVDDGVRLDGSKNIMIDHLSVQNANDESFQISRASYISIQNTLLGEPIGDHVDLAGILMNYSTSSQPLDNLSVHHTMWSRVGGRMPEMSCEENTADDHVSGSNCSGHVNHVDLVSNLMWDQYAQIYYNECTGTNEGNPADGTCSGHQSVQLNWINNASFARSTVSYAGTTGDVLMDQLSDSTTASNRIYATGNLLNGSTAESALSSAATAHSSPSITQTAASGLVSYMTTNVGTFPRDTMDTRIVGYLGSDVNSTNTSWFTGSAMNDSAEGVAIGDAYTITSPTVSFPTDTDNDGMPDAWESLHGLDPATDDHNATTLSAAGGGGITGCSTGYTNIECYLNELQVNRVAGTY